MPYALPPMGARFLGGWAALNAVVASALARRDNGLLAIVLALFPARALVALVIDGGDFGAAGLYAGALVLMGLGPLVSTNVRGTATGCGCR
jgi:hypothetical protein